LKLVDLVKLLAFFKLVSNLGRVIAFYGVLLAIIGINMQTVSFPFILIVFMHIRNLIQRKLLEFSFVSVILVSVHNQLVCLRQYLQGFATGTCNAVFYINIMHVF
jgi:hypothetical protein